MWDVCFLTWDRRDSTPARVDMSAGAEMARAPGWRLGRAFSLATASSQAADLREEMNTFEAPAWRRLGEC